MTHYTKEDLELYRHGQMTILGRISCSTHLRECTKCQKLLEELKQDDQLIATLKESVQIFNELSKLEPQKQLTLKT